MNEKQSFFSSFTPKTAFILGLIGGVLVICTVGFFVLLVSAVSAKNIAFRPAAVNNQPTTAALPGQAAPTDANARVDVQISSGDHIRGNKNAPVKIVEFSDFQCPYCGAFHPTMQQVIYDYCNQVAWIYKHFPLDSLHPNARPAAEASECIYEQAGDDGFWKFADEVIANQSQLSAKYYQQLAQEIGVNLTTFNDCVSSGKYQQKVEADYQQGVSYGVNGTPGNFINGIPVRGALPYASIKQIIDSELQ